jgi:signal transduction histidine kinase
MKWLVYFMATAVIVQLLVFELPGTLFYPELFRTIWYELIILSVFWGYPLIIGIAVFKYRLYAIDLVINRTLVYGGLTLIVIGIYALTVGLLSLLFHTSGSLVISLVATGFIAVLFQPLHQRLQRGVNRLMFGERDDPTAVLTRLGQRLEAISQPDAVLPAIVETVTQALKLPYAAIVLADETVVAEIGRPSNTPLHAFPLVYQSEMVGQLQVAARSPGEGLNAADERVLRQVALQAGTAVHAIRLTHDLQQSRIHIVTTREEERRRLRRDLHDELGPVIASQGLKLAAARELLYTDPDTAVRLLDDVLAKNQNTVAEVRRLVYNLRPPTLDELGLVGAICEYVHSSEQIGLKVTITATDNLPPLSAAVEAAAYRIVAEAFTNVLRHAAAQDCWIEIKAGEMGDGIISHLPSLFIKIEDDGVGLRDNGRAGIGLLSMRERAEEVGGACKIVSGEKGVRVTAVLPIEEKNR